MSASRPLVCCAMRLGYGPSAKLLVVAEELRRRGARLLFIGSGIAHELVSRSRGVFETVLRCSPDDPRAINIVRSSVGMLSIMDREFAALATQMGKPLYVVDSLLWMRPSIPAEFHAATTYWAQRFVAEDERDTDFPLGPTVVGPIIAPIPKGRSAKRNGIVVNLGGCESSADRELDQAYADFIVRGLIRFRKAVAPNRFFMVIAGKRCAELLRVNFKDAEIEFASLPHDKVLLRLQSAEVVITSPGLTATLECFGRGIPTYFLPPQ